MTSDQNRPIVLAILFTLLCLSCGKDEAAPPDFTPEIVSASDLVVWQRLNHSWLYNHRWGRLGSGFVRFDPNLDLASYPAVERPLVTIPDGPVWAYVGKAGAGTGKDIGTHIANGTRISNTDVYLGSLTEGRRIKGPEGEVVSETWTVSVDRPDDVEATDVIEATLNGFWLTTVGEAKQPYRFAIDVGSPSVNGDTLSVDVVITMGVDCDTPECKGCSAKLFSKSSDDFAYDLFIDVAIIAGPTNEFSAQRFEGAQISATWDGPPSSGEGDICLVPRDKDDCLEYWVDCGDPRLENYDEMATDVGRESVEQPLVPTNVVTLGITGFDLELNHEHHMLELDIGASNITTDEGSSLLTFEQHLRFQNWRKGMNERGQDADPLSATAFGTDGEFSGTVSFTQLGFRDAEVEPIVVEETIITEAEQTILIPLD